MTDRVIVYEDKAGEFRWRRVAPNGEPVAASEGYTEKQSAIEAAERQAGDDAEVVLPETKSVAPAQTSNDPDESAEVA